MALGLDDDSCDPGQTSKTNILNYYEHQLLANERRGGPSVPRCGFVGAPSRSFERISLMELVEQRGSRTRNLYDVWCRWTECTAIHAQDDEKDK